MSGRWYIAILAGVNVNVYCKSNGLNLGCQAHNPCCTTVRVSSKQGVPRQNFLVPINVFKTSYEINSKKKRKKLPNHTIHQV